jgi:hypothetical protein
MTSPAGAPMLPPPPLAGPPTRRPGWRDRWTSRDELRDAVRIVAALAVLGAVLGIVWQKWSPPGPLGFVISPGAVEADETEAFAAADGRFAIISLVVGVLAGVVVFRRKATRGPAAALALVVGGLAGALLTDLVGHLLGGGTDNGPANTLIKHLPLSVHMHGLLVLEAGLAVLVYGLCVSFAPDDDLGRPEPQRAFPPWPPGYAAVPSVGMGGQLQDPGRDADAPGELQQRYLPPQ